MIGLGKWTCTVDSMLFRGEVTLEIIEKNGSYDFVLELPGVEIPSYTLKSVEEDSNSIKAVISVDTLGKDAELEVNFDESGDAFTGILKVPFIGKIRLKNGHRV